MILDRLRSWPSYLLEPVDAASTAVFRIVLGVVLAWDAARYMAYRWIDEYYILPKVHFTYLFFDFVRPWPGQWMYVHFAFLGLVALFFAAGLFYRVAAPLLFLAYTYVFLLEESVYMNHYYLICLLLFLFIFAPVHRAYSLDRWRAPAPPPPVVPRWTVALLRFQLVVVYVYGAVAKLNPDWLSGEPMYSEIVRRGPDVPSVAAHFPPALLAYAIAYGGILIDAGVPLLLCLRRTRLIGFVVATVFHVLNDAFLSIGLFSYLMFGAVTIFFDPDWPRRLRARLLGERAPVAAAAPRPARVAPRQLLLIAGLHLYVLVQLLFPLRHWLYPGPVSWTEEGHRFAWQMKLRKKESVLTLHVRDPASGREWTIDPARDLRPRQMKKLHTFPDMMVQYVHHVRDQLRAEGIADPVITVDWMCSLNGAPYQRLVDPTVDFAKVERSWRRAKWILPADTPRSDSTGRPAAQSTGLLSKDTSAAAASP